MAWAEVEEFFREHRDLVVKEFRERLAFEVQKKAKRGDQAEWYMENRAPFGRAKLLTYMGFLAGRGCDASRVGDHARSDQLWAETCMFVEAAALAVTAGAAVAANQVVASEAVAS